MAGTRVGEKPKTRIEDSIERLNLLAKKIDDSRITLDRINDSVLGAMPEPCAPVSDTPARDGSIGKLEDAIDIVTNSVDDIARSVNKLADSGAI